VLLPRLSRALLAGLVLLANPAMAQLRCDDHGGAPASTAAPPHHEGAQHGEVPTGGEDSCELPALPSCCPMMLSCAGSLAGPPDTAFRIAEDGSGPGGAALVGPLLFQSSTPEPPPPKV
jgi:hypothetical protein